MKKGLFIVFEGVDGSGKSVVSKNIYEKLKKRFKNREFILTREPGGSNISEEIRKIILNKNNIKMDKITELLLYTASRRQHLSLTIIPSLQQNKIVICDRYIHSSLAYQGYGREIGYQKVYEMNMLAIENIMPDLVIFLDINYKEALQRISHRKKTDRLDNESLEFHKKVYDGYQKIIKKTSSNFIVIDASQSQKNVENDIIFKLTRYIKNQEKKWGSNEITK